MKVLIQSMTPHCVIAVNHCLWLFYCIASPIFFLVASIIGLCTVDKRQTPFYLSISKALLSLNFFTTKYVRSSVTWAYSKFAGKERSSQTRVSALSGYNRFLHKNIFYMED
jgi:hypothetical protein